MTNIKERLAQDWGVNGGSRQPTFLKKTAIDYDDDDGVDNDGI